MIQTIENQPQHTREAMLAQQAAVMNSDRKKKFDIQRSVISSMVRGIYDLQKMRIQSGNRVAKNFKDKLKENIDLSTLTGEQQDALFKKILKSLQSDYKRITDTISEIESQEDTKLPSKKKFTPHGIITDYNELILVDQYMRLLKTEEKSFSQLEGVLDTVEIYNRFLKTIPGVGPAMAGVIVSEIDIYAATYPSSLHAYCGLDVMTIGVYYDEQNVEHKINVEEYENLLSKHSGSDGPLFYKGYQVFERQVGASRKAECMVSIEYEVKDKKTKEVEKKIRQGIRHNPFLKTKLVGVLSGSMLKSSRVYMDGSICSNAARLSAAKAKGFVPLDEDDVDMDAVDAFLNDHGHRVVAKRSAYVQTYYDYKQRLKNHPVHQSKTDAHQNRMALRYMIKRFLIDLYKEWRALEGLPIAPEYSEGKLGMIHGQVKPQ